MLLCIMGLYGTSIQVVAQGADQDYIAIYKVIKQADQFKETGLSEQAAQFYASAAKELKAFQKANPNWNPRVIQFRLKYLTRQMEDLPTVAQPSNPSSSVVSNAGDTAQVANPSQEPSKEMSEQYQGQILALNQRLQQLREENQLYIGKLREAMSARPTGFNPEDLKEAEGKIMDLNKERDLLKAQLDKTLSDSSKSNDAQIAESNQQLEAAQSTIEEQQNLIASLKQQMVASAAPGSDDALIARDQLVQDLMEQNALLRREAQGRSTVTEEPSVISQETSQTSEVKPAKKARWSWWPFQRSTRRKGDTDPWMRAKLAVYEAERVPFSPEELALLESGVDETLLSEGPAFQPTRTLSMDQGADMDRLEREATQAIDANDFAGASERLLQILEVLPDNVAILSNLAFVEMQLERLDMAQTRLQKALDLDPNYVNAHMLLGMLQAEKQNPEEALNYLSKGAAIQPENPQIQNQLGVVLSELGQREAAETAFRKAVALQPSHAEAHINLALVYASQEPASPKLAMYHYQLALDAGHDKEPRLERLLSEIQP